MNNLTINIGLSTQYTNTYYYDNQLIETKKYLSKLFDFLFVISEGTWYNTKEKTLVCAVNVQDIKIHTVKILLSNLCIDLNQDAIAFKLNNEGHIVFNPLYTGEQFEFSEEKYQNF